MAVRLRTELYSPELKGPFLLDNSLTVKIGDLVAFSTSSPGVLTNDASAVAGDVYVAGYVHGFTNAKGELLGDGSLTMVTTDANNTTTKQYWAVIVPIYQHYEYYVDVNADLGTTPNSDKAGVYFDMANASEVDENSVALPGAAGTPKQILSLGPAQAPDGTTSKRVIIARFVKTIWQRP